MAEAPKSFDLGRWQGDFARNTHRLEQLRLHANIRRASGGWSASQCIEHLRLTAIQYLTIWSEVVLDPDAREGSNYALWWRWFLAGIANPRKLKAKTIGSFEPTANEDLLSAIDRYLSIRERVWEVASQVNQSRKGGTKVRSPFASWMKYPADFSFDLWMAHEHRHLTQAESA